MTSFLRHIAAGAALLAAAVLQACGGADPQADVVVSGSGPSQPTAPGSVVEFRMRVANAGPDDADTVVLANTLDPQLTLVSIECDAEGGARCPGTPALGMSLDGLPSGSALNFTVRARLPATVSGLQVSNTLATRRVPGDPDLANNEATATALVANARLTVAYVGDGFVTLGDDFALRATVVNLGPGAVTDLALTRVDPSGVTPRPLRCEAFGDAVCPTDLSAATLVVPSLPVGGRLEFQVPYGTAGAAVGQVGGSFAAAAGSDPFPGDNRASASVRLVSPGSVLVVAHDAAPDAAAGDPVVFRAEVRNRDLRSVFGAVLTVDLPPGMTASDWTCSAGGSAQCPAALGPSMSLAALPGGGSLVFGYRVPTAPSQAGTALAATFEAIADGVAAGPDNRVQAVADLRAAQADLQVREVMSAPPQAGSPMRLLVTLNNFGPDTARGVSLTQSLEGAVEPGSVAVECSATGGAACPAPWSGTTPLADLPAGASLRFTVSALASAVGGTVHAVASVLSAADPVSDNDTADLTVAVPVPPTGLSANLATAAAVAAGNEAVFTATVVNGGPRAAEHLALDFGVDGLSGAVSVSCLPAAGAHCPDVLGPAATLDSLPAGTWLQLVYRLAVPPQAGAGSIVRGRFAVQADGDPATGDNLAGAQTTVVAAAADLQLAATVADVVPAGETADVVVTLTNRGPSDATAITLTMLTDPLTAAPTLLCSGAGGASCAIDASDARALTIDRMPAGGVLRLTYGLPTTGLAIGSPLQVGVTSRYAGDPEAGNDSVQLRTTIAPAADARNGSYRMLVADGRQRTLELDFDRAEMRVDGVISPFSGPQADGSYQTAGGSRFHAANGLVVGLDGAAGALQPYVAARDMVTDLAELGDGTDLALLGRGIEAGVPGSRYAGARLGRERLEICSFSTPLAIASCPESAIRRFRLSLVGDRIDALAEDGSGATFSFRVARADGNRVLLRASRSADGTDALWQVGLMAQPPADRLTIGPSTAGDWRRYELQVAPPTLTVSGDASDVATLGADTTGLPQGLLGGLRASDSAGVFVFGSSQLTVMVVARGAPATGFVSIGLTR